METAIQTTAKGFLSADAGNISSTSARVENFADNRGKSTFEPEYSKLTSHKIDADHSDIPTIEESKFSSLCYFPISSDSRMMILRVAVLFSLLATAVVVGYFSYTLLHDNEVRLKNHHYESTVDQLEIFVSQLMTRQYEALSLVATAYRNRCPDPAQWPRCTVPFSFMSPASGNLISMTSSRAVGFSPFVKKEEVASLETFVYNFYNTQGYPYLGKTSGFSGIYAKNGSNYYHMTEPAMTGENQILVPIVQIANITINKNAYMYNLYSEPVRIANIDHMINCTHTRGVDCLAISDVLHLVQDPVFRPAILLHYPIRLADANRTVVGLVSGVLNWDTIFSYSFPVHLNGFYIILRSERNGLQKYYTFEINQGKAEFRGEGDLHNRKYDYTRRSFLATRYCGSAIYYVDIYSSSEFDKAYFTHGPIIACVISVLVIIVTSFIFMLYDLLMNRRAREKELVIQTRQQFVRFISHEIRTPVNTISLGMKLFNRELLSMLQDSEAQRNDHDSSSSNNNMTMIADLSPKLVNMLDLVRDVEQSSEAAILILNDLINYDKLKGGMLQLEVEVVMILELVRNSIRPFTIQAQQVQVTIELDLFSSNAERREASTMMVLGDRVKISQVIRNLVSNALKFTPSGGTVTVSAIWRRDGLPKAPRLIVNCPNDEDGHSTVSGSHQKSPRSGEVLSRSNSLALSDSNHTAAHHSATNESAPVRCGSLLILVKDSGVGLSEEQQGQLFREGVQFNANKLQGGGGSGLGLFIAKGIAELHGGHLRGSSEGIGKGCTFTLELPVYQPAQTIVDHGNNDVFQSHMDDVEEGGGHLHFRPSSLSDVEIDVNRDSDIYEGLRAESRASEGGGGGGGGISVAALSSLYPNQSDHAKNSNSNSNCSKNHSHNNSNISHPIDDCHSISDQFDTTVRRKSSFSSISDASTTLSASSPSRDDYLRQSNSYTHANAKSNNTNKNRNKRILVVDDSILARKMVVKLLVSEGFQVEQCGDGQSCVNLVTAHFRRSTTTTTNGAGSSRNSQDTDHTTSSGSDASQDATVVQQDTFTTTAAAATLATSTAAVASLSEEGPYYHAILLDSEMPNVSGLQVAQQLRAMGYPYLIVGVTGHVHKQDIDAFLQHGASYVLQKPLDYPKLETILNDLDTTASVS